MHDLTVSEKKTSKTTSLSKAKLNDAIKEECRILQNLVKAKHALEWMTENKYLVPQKLMEDIQVYERDAELATQKLQSVLNNWNAKRH